MFLDFRTIRNGTAIESDLCVIGAGAAGITIARELIGKSLRVCLVESGGLDYEVEPQSLYEGKKTLVCLITLWMRLVCGTSEVRRITGRGNVHPLAKWIFRCVRGCNIVAGRSLSQT